MADQQIEDLTAITSLADGDELLINDVSDTSDDAGGSPKKMVASNVLDYMRMPLDTEYDATSAAKAKTLVVNQITPIDLSDGTLNGNVIVTLPSASAGDRTGFYVIKKCTVAGSFSQAPGYAAEIATSTKIHTVSYTQKATGTDKWGLWLPGEILMFRYIDATFGWLVEHDGRIPQYCELYRTADTSSTALPNATVTKVEFTNANGNAGMDDLTNEYIDIKRTSPYRLEGLMATIATTANTPRVIAQIENNTTTTVYRNGEMAALNTSIPGPVCIVPYVTPAAADELKLNGYQNSGTGEEFSQNCTFAAWEILE